MSLFENPFERIRAGKKIIEVRLFDEKRQKVKIGDIIVFDKLPDKKERIAVEVYGLSRFNSFSDLFSIFDESKFGHKSGITLEDQISGMREIYTVEEEAKYGVLGIHLHLLNKIPMEH